MELMLDTANLDEVIELDAMLDVAGVTTNPTIITGSGRAPEEVIGDLVGYLRPSQKLFVQVLATDTEGIVEEARRICALREKNTYAKIPVTHAGLRAIKACKAEGLGVLATAIYSADQALLAAMNGADYLAPYVNRMCAYGDGVGQVLDLLGMLSSQGLGSRVVAASFKNVSQVHELVAAGVHALTVAPDVARSMVDHPGTGIAVDEFVSAWRAAYGRASLFA